MAASILAVNVGSSSIKVASYCVEPVQDDAAPILTPDVRIEVSGIASSAPYSTAISGGVLCPGASGSQRFSLPPTISHSGALQHCAELLRAQPGFRPPELIVHRVVHGGSDTAPVRECTPEVMIGLQKLEQFAPLHQSLNLQGTEIFRAEFPAARSLVCFDTALHAEREAPLDRYAIPDSLYEQGIRRYGFHGLAIQGAIMQLRATGCTVGRRAVFAHLGSGVSVSALLDGKSIASTMGATPLDGVVMGTRCGQLDPGALLALLSDQASGLSVERLTTMLYRESGLLALSGISADMRDLVSSNNSRAAMAVQYFVQEVVKGIGAMAASINGIDTLVFSGGIGEHQHVVRSSIIERLAWLGVDLGGLDPEVLEQKVKDKVVVELSSPKSSVKVFMVCVDEQRVMVEHVVFWAQQQKLL